MALGSLSGLGDQWEVDDSTHADAYIMSEPYADKHNAHMLGDQELYLGRLSKTPQKEPLNPSKRQKNKKKHQTLPEEATPTT